MKNCKNCGKEFQPKNPKGKFCSTKCRVYFNRELAIIKIKLQKRELTGVRIDLEDIKGNTQDPYFEIAPVHPITVKPKTFDELLTDAKNGNLDMAELQNAKLSSNQKSLILRKRKA